MCRRPAGRARYRCVAALATPDGDGHRTPRAICEGTLRRARRARGLRVRPDLRACGLGRDDGRADRRAEGPDQPPGQGVPGAPARSWQAIPERRRTPTGLPELKVARRRADVPADGDERRAEREPLRRSRPWSDSSGWRRGPLGIALSIAFVIVVGIIDHLTGPGVSLAPFYLMPVVLATWNGGPRLGARDGRDGRRGHAGSPTRSTGRACSCTPGTRSCGSSCSGGGRVARRRARGDGVQSAPSPGPRDRGRRRSAVSERHEEHPAARRVARPQGPARRGARRDADDPPRREARPDRQGDGGSLRRDRAGGREGGSARGGPPRPGPARPRSARPQREPADVASIADRLAAELPTLAGHPVRVDGARLLVERRRRR